MHISHTCFILATMQTYILCNTNFRPIHYTAYERWLFFLRHINVPASTSYSHVCLVPFLVRILWCFCSKWAVSFCTLYVKGFIFIIRNLLGHLPYYIICIVTWNNDWFFDDPVILVSSFCVPLHSLRSRGARKWNSCQLRKGKNTLLLV